MLWSFALVGIGGAAGSIGRYGISLLLGKFAPGPFPLATFGVNIAGCFIIGMILGAYAAQPEANPLWRLLLATGFCGGFTTFSAFSAENLLLLQNGSYSWFFIYLLSSLIGGIVAVWLGILLLR